jgi:GNAT superfamily N-acetyltransferase
VEVDVQLLDPASAALETVLGWHWREWSASHADADLAAWRARLRERCGADAIPFTLLAVVDATAVGCVTVCHDDADPAFADRGPWLSGMLVVPHARNLGVGRALLVSAAARARELGAGELWLSTAEAARFYRRCGYRVARPKDGLTGDAVLWVEL